ncbi:hypothetical protein [Sphingomonas zeae]|jgi:hypothetical protein
MSNIAHKTLAVVTVMALGITAPALAAAQNQAPATPPATVTNEPDPAAVQKVADAITAAIAALPATASEQDVEAAISFAVSQQGQSAAVNVAALTYLAKQPGNQSRKVKNALANALSAARRGLSGTGGTGGAGTTAATLGAGPAIGGGGVGVNYTTQN